MSLKDLSTGKEVLTKKESEELHQKWRDFVRSEDCTEEIAEFMLDLLFGPLSVQLKKLKKEREAKENEKDTHTPINDDPSE